MGIQKRDKRVLRTQRILRENLFLLLEQKPLDKITVSELTELAEVNRSTFYFYYENIYDMTRQIQDEIYEKFRSSVIENEEPSSETTNLERYIMRFTVFIKENAAMCAFIVKYDLNNQLLEKIKADITKNLSNSAEIFPVNDPRRYFTDFGQAGVTETILHWLEDGMKIPPEELTRFICKMYYSGKYSFQTTL